MAVLSDNQRKQLEKAVLAAREAADKGARAALQRLAVDRPRAFTEMGEEEQALRLALRAHARRLGDRRSPEGEQGIDRLAAECAYEHWHRMLFARFLAENGLLIHPEHGVAVTLTECEELAHGEGAPNGWALAARYAARMLPRIFRPDDPLLKVPLAPEHQQALESILAGIVGEVFTAEDSLGWVYQFWQKKRKDEVNASGSKIGPEELPAVTQLFTEPYMVQFLLHNTLGAWWAGKAMASRTELTVTAQDENALRGACGLPGYDWTYLRFAREEEGQPWRPAAGTYEGWPSAAAKLRVLDPCCGSGHFVVEAFRILVALRRAEEGLSPSDACNAVLRDNLFALELDERCTQIAAFNLALAAWTYPGAGGFRSLPDIHVACSGLSVGAKEGEWLAVAGDDVRLRDLMRRLYRLFADAPTLGSLLDPRATVEGREGEIAFDDEYTFEEAQPLLDRALVHHPAWSVEIAEIGIAAQGMARAAAILSSRYTLVVTNVPYLGRKNQTDMLRAWSERHANDARADLATVLTSRMLRCLDGGGSLATVTPQNWHFLTSYRQLRQRLLQEWSWNLVTRLGPGAFGTISGQVVSVALMVLSAIRPHADHSITALDASTALLPREKARLLRDDPAEPGTCEPPDVEAAEHAQVGTAQGGPLIWRVSQADQLRNPDARITLRPLAVGPRLATVANSLAGMQNGDAPRYLLCVWEVALPDPAWNLILAAPDSGSDMSGRCCILRWEGGRGGVVDSPSACIRGMAAWGREGVAISLLGSVRAVRYWGEMFDQTLATIVPFDPELLPILWTFLRSDEYVRALRAIDQKLNLTNATLGKVAFDRAYWTERASRLFPVGLPEPQSNDPTQWLFSGHPAGMVASGCSSASPIGLSDPIGAERHKALICRTPNMADVLQVGVARLLGYRWPAEVDTGMRLDVATRAWAARCSELASLTDADGIVCIPAVGAEQPAAERLQRLLAAAFAESWTSSLVQRLLAEVGFADRTLDEWLRDAFFEQHCMLFQQRPFIWHIWDGRKRDGFAALVNYHKLDRKLLERLAYTVLGGWILGQKASLEKDEKGAADRLAAATALQQKLTSILEGERPHDIFVRWKPVEEQSLGWDPDPGDGVRLNIRPFVEAGVLRKPPKGVQWKKDRGGESKSLRPADSFPWFWKDGEFKGERVNDVHLTLAEKRAARAAKGRPC